MPRLEEWSVCGGTWYEQQIACYLPPEKQHRYLQGFVYDHPKFPDGHFVVTTYIVEVVDGQVVTRSGSRYTLGTPDPKFVDLCVEQGWHIPTPEEPLRVSNVRQKTGSAA